MTGRPAEGVTGPAWSSARRAAAQEAAAQAVAAQAAVAADWELMQADFHRLLDRVTDADLARPVPGLRWTLGELLEHLVQSLETTPTEVEALRRGEPVRGGLPRWLPAGAYAWRSLREVRRRARGATVAGLRRRYAARYAAALASWRTLPPDEWQAGAAFYADGRRIVAEVAVLTVAHYVEHAAQARAALES